MKSISKLLCVLAIPAIACLLAACATTPNVSVASDYDHSASFGNYHTYSFDAAAAALNPTNTAVLEESLRSNLATRGFSESKGSADLYVVPAVLTKEKLQVMPGSNVTYWPSRYGRYGYWPNATMAADVTEYTEGTLVLDFVDRKTHKLVYRGVAKGIVSTQERNAEAIKLAVTKIVAGYPAAR